MDSEQEDYEDSEEEEEVEEQPQRIKKDSNPPLQSQKKPKTKMPEVQATKMPESRYVAYRVQAEEGIMDTETNLVIGKEVYVILAEILNKLNNIEVSQS